MTHLTSSFQWLLYLGVIHPISNYLLPSPPSPNSWCVMVNSNPPLQFSLSPWHTSISWIPFLFLIILHSTSHQSGKFLSWTMVWFVCNLPGKALVCISYILARHQDWTGSTKPCWGQHSYREPGINNQQCSNKTVRETMLSGLVITELWIYFYIVKIISIISIIITGFNI